jgi:hypothetical protein
MKAVVVFHGDGSDPREYFEGTATHPLSRFLRRGFKHCFVCLRTGDYWVRFDGRSGIPLVQCIADADFDLAAFYRDAGFTVVETAQRGAPQRTLFVMNNCVGLVKAALCIRAPFAWSPWQLHNHLTHTQPTRKQRTRSRS